MRAHKRVMVKKQTPPEERFWDFLSEREANFVDNIMRSLDDMEWARPLLADIRRNGGLTWANKAKFFELRFGYALHQAGVVMRYEVPGEAKSTLDFGFSWKNTNWLVELMRLEETHAVRSATQTHTDDNGTPWASLQLSTNAEDPTHSIEGETLKAVQRICQKCESEGRPHKFPTPAETYHAILVDFRTFADGGDPWDRIHVGLGGEYVKDPFKMYWDKRLISGVFNRRTNVFGAAEARERVHFLGFVDEKKFSDGGFAAGTQFIANPFLFDNAEDMRAAIENWPLQPVRVLNGAD